MRKHADHIILLSLIVVSVLFSDCRNANKKPAEEQGTSLNPSAEILIGVPKFNKWGFIDQFGRWAISPQFDDVHQFASEPLDKGAVFSAGDFTAASIGGTKRGIFGLFVDSKWGFIDRAGNWVINPLYDSVGSLNDGLIPALVGGVRDKEGEVTGGKWGYIDINGRWVISPQFEEIGGFRDGFAKARTSESKWGIIDKSGRWVGSPRFDEILDFDEGYAPASISGGDGPGPVKRTRISYYVMRFSNKYNENVGQGGWGFIDTQGNWIISPQFDRVSSFHYGWAVVSPDGTATNPPDLDAGKCGVIDKSGRWVIKPQYEDIVVLEGGLAAATTGGKAKSPTGAFEKKWGIIDKNGNWVLSPQFDYIREYSNGIAPAQIGGTQGESNFVEGGKWGYIDKAGRWAINPQFSNARPFYGDLAEAALEGRSQTYPFVDDFWGIIDRSGRWIVNPQIESPLFYGPFFVSDYYVGQVGGKYSVFDRSGKCIWNQNDAENEKTQVESQETIGSGFYISAEGHIITNAHVVHNAKEIKISGLDAQIIKEDLANDIALLKISAKPASYATFSRKIEVEVGEEICTYGFPLTGILSSAGSLSVGTVSSLSGIGDNVSQLQISVPVQPGNSGGPILNRKGHVIGIVVSKLNEKALRELTGSSPENVNFGINASIVKSFLKINKVPYRKSGWLSFNKSNENIAAEAQKYTVKIECFR